MCVSESHTPNFSHPHISPLPPASCFLCLWVCLGFVGKLTHFLGSTYTVAYNTCPQYLLQRVWSSLKATHVAAKGITSFFFKIFWLNNVPLWRRHHIFSIRSSGGGLLACFPVLVIMNTAAMNTEVVGSFRMTVFSGYIPKNGIAGWGGNSVFSF